MKVLPPQIAFIYLMIAFILNAFIKTPMTFDYNYKLLGMATVVMGSLVMLWAWMLFRKNQTPVRPTLRPKQFVTRGPFEWSRNPMYLGIVLILMGIACYVGSVIMLIAPGAFFITINAIYIPYEEKVMGRIFGEEYREYQQRVRRWL